MIHWLGLGPPYDFVTFFVMSVLFGIFLAWGMRVGNKVP